jgi:hypothetical protein
MIAANAPTAAAGLKNFLGVIVVVLSRLFGVRGRIVDITKEM